MVLGIAHNGNAAATGDHHIPLGNGFRGVIGSFGVNIRANKADEIANVGRVKYEYGIYVGKSSENFCAFILGNARPASAFEGAHTGIRVYSHHQIAPQLFGAAQITHVSNVQNIKTAVGEDDLFTNGPPLLHSLGKLLQVHQLVGSGRQSQSSMTARRSSARVTVAVPRFITTMPPA